MRYREFLLAAALLLLLPCCYGQRDRSYDDVVVTQTRIDARDLGDVYGATSGSRAHLFVLNPRHGYVQPLGVIPGASSITNAIVVSASGDIFLGTSPGGHLLKYTPHDEYEQQIKIGNSLPATDLGQAIPGESIFTLAIDRDARVIYGLTFPNAHFFQYSIDSARFRDLGVVSEKVPQGEKFQKDKIMARMIVVDQQGMAFTSGENGSLFRFNPKTQILEKLPIRAPAVPGREPWTRVDAFLLDPSGVIYGGTSDGYLFRFDPAKLTVTNLGKPLNQYRIVGLVRVPNGQLYGVGGNENEMARLFSYDPSTGAYVILGFIDVNRRPYYTWQAYVVGALACGSDGTVYIGENERVSKLYLFYP
jgi:hypothetical protein